MQQSFHAGTFPARVTLELTNLCNLSCTFCPRHTMGGGKGMMSKQLATKIIDELAEHLPITLVPFFRGESLLNPYWDHILSYAVKKGLGPIQFTTNGTLLTPQNAVRLLDTNIHFISFSLDTLDPVLYEATRRKAQFDQVMQNIHYFLDVHKKRNSSMEIQVSAVETQSHSPGMKAFIDYWKPLVDRVRVFIEHSKDGNPGSIDTITLPSKRLPCNKPYTDIIIYWDGEVGICNHDWQRPAKGPYMGSVLQQTIAEIWNNTAYTHLRQAHEGQRALDTPCSSCSHWVTHYLDEQVLGRVYTNTSRRSP